jgi:hypothetical protein
MKSDCRLVLHSGEKIVVPIEVRIAIIQQKLDRVREHRNLLIHAHTIRISECTAYLENLISQIEILRREVGVPECERERECDYKDKPPKAFWRNLFRRFI